MHRNRSQQPQGQILEWHPGQLGGQTSRARWGLHPFDYSCTIYMGERVIMVIMLSLDTEGKGS